MCFIYIETVGVDNGHVQSTLGQRSDISFVNENLDTNSFSIQIDLFINKIIIFFKTYFLINLTSYLNLNLNWTKVNWICTICKDV